MRPNSQPPPSANARPGDFETVKTLLPYLWPKDRRDLRLRVVVSMALLAGAKVMTVMVPVILKYTVDALSLPIDQDALAANAWAGVPVLLLLAYGAARTIALLFRELQGAIFARVGEYAVREAALRTFEHLHRLSLRFHLDRQTGGLSRAIERGTRGIEFVIRIVLFNVAPTLLEIIMVAMLLWGMLDAGFAIVTMLTIAVYITWTVLITEWRNRFRRQMNENDSKAHTKAIDSLLNYETVKYFGNEDHEAKRFDQALVSYETAAVKSKTSLSILNTGQGAVIAIGVTLVMLMAGKGVSNGTMTIGDFVLVNTFLLQLYLPLNFLGSVYREIKHSLTDMEAMFSLLDEDEEVTDKPSAPAIDIKGGEVVFSDVSFAYDPRRAILDGVSFTIPAGNTVAVVGASGAGKSTISRLLFRFYDVSAGKIEIDGQDIRDVSQSSLRGAIGIVPQDTVLFNDTIYYNIAYGRTSASPAEVEQAARLAQIHDFVMSLPDGYQSVVGERGLKLSGGEKQRVAIARTILKRPSILVFDEATSALDTHTEKEIQSSLRDVSAGHTTLVVAHRLSTIIDADEILVLGDGRVQERGTHGELLALGGHYSSMWKRQQEADLALETLVQSGELDDELAELAIKST